MWQILHVSFLKFTKLSNSGISSIWSIIDEVTTRNTTAYFFGPLCRPISCGVELAVNRNQSSLCDLAADAANK